MTFLKLDLLDAEDEPIITKIEDANIHMLLINERHAHKDDDRLSPCHGYPKKVEISDNTIQWIPGDGGSYTVAMYFEDTPGGRNRLQQELTDREIELTIPE
jgi:hypothetical protein